MSLIHPVHQPAHRDPGVQDHVDEVRCGQALHVLDALLEEAGLVHTLKPSIWLSGYGGLSDGTTTRSAVAANRWIACIPARGKKPIRKAMAAAARGLLCGRI